jgi:hypothetical protein
VAVGLVPHSVRHCRRRLQEVSIPLAQQRAAAEDHEHDDAQHQVESIELKKSSRELPGEPFRSTMPLTMLPKMLSGENPPALAQVVIISPIRTGLILAARSPCRSAR